MIDAFGWIVAVLGCSISLPQLFRLVRSRTVAGVALTTWQVTLGANLAWASHGFVVDRGTIWGPNLVLAVWTLLILQMFHRHTGAPWSRLLLPGVVLAGITTAIDLAAGPVAFAVAALVPSVISMTAQLVTLVRSTELTGVSSAFLVVNVINQALWLVWSMLIGEQAMLLASSLIGALWVVNLTWFGLRRAGLVGPIRPVATVVAGAALGVVDGIPGTLEPIPSVIDALPDMEEVVDALPDVITDGIPGAVADALPVMADMLPGVTACPDGPPATDHG